MVRLALLERLQSGHLFDHRLDGGRDPVVQLGALDGRPVPELILGFSGLCHRLVDIGGARQRNVGDVLAGGGGDEPVNLRPGALGPLTGDVDLRRIGHASSLDTTTLRDIVILTLMSSARLPESLPLWWDGLEFGNRAGLADDIEVDVAVVGGGYTGLWTAYELSRLDPGLSVAVLESDHIGYGASGRNGGWCYDGFAAGMERIEQMSDIDTARAFGAVLREMVGVVGEVIAAEGIECDYHHGGSIEFLRNGGQLARAEQAVASARRYGWTEADLRLLPAAEALEIGRAADVVGGLWSRHTAALHPGKLVQGLAAAVERRGVRIYEGTAAESIEGARVVTSRGPAVRADDRHRTAARWSVG